MPESDLALLIRTARAAGWIALPHWRADPKVWIKPDDSPVSAADLDVNAYLHETLTAARPGYAWSSEESPDSAGRMATRRAFIVDPIDGTRAFLKGERSWSHSLAITEEGRPIAAVVHLPASGKLYAAAAGQGATLDDAPLAVSPRAATILAASAALGPAHWRRPPDVARHFRPSLAYRLALVAEGRFDAMFTHRPAWDWDIAAGCLLVAEAGGTVTDRHGAPLRFNGADRRSPGVLAAGAGHGALLASLA